jgi:hypothetical protein
MHRYLENQIGIPTKTQKLMLSHAAASNMPSGAPAVIRFSDPITSKTLSEAGIVDGSKLLLIGTSNCLIVAFRMGNSSCGALGVQERLSMKLSLSKMRSLMLSSWDSTKRREERNSEEHMITTNHQLSCNLASGRSKSFNSSPIRLHLKRSLSFAASPTTQESWP